MYEAEHGMRIHADIQGDCVYVETQGFAVQTAPGVHSVPHFVFLPSGAFIATKYTPRWVREFREGLNDMALIPIKLTKQEIRFFKRHLQEDIQRMIGAT
jgi:hypothetical protein